MYSGMRSKYPSWLFKYFNSKFPEVYTDRQIPEEDPRYNGRNIMIIKAKDENISPNVKDANNDSPSHP